MYDHFQVPHLQMGSVWWGLQFGDHHPITLSWTHGSAISLTSQYVSAWTSIGTWICIVLTHRSVNQRSVEVFIIPQLGNWYTLISKSEYTTDPTRSLGMDYPCCVPYNIYNVYNEHAINSIGCEYMFCKVASSIDSNVYSELCAHYLLLCQPWTKSHRVPLARWTRWTPNAFSAPHFCAVIHCNPWKFTHS